MMIFLTFWTLTVARADLRLGFDYHEFRCPPFASLEDFEAFRASHDHALGQKYPESAAWLVAPAAVDHEFRPAPPTYEPPTAAELAHGGWMRAGQTAGRFVIPFILPSKDAARLKLDTIPFGEADLVLVSYDEEIARVALPDAESVLAEIDFDRAFAPARLTLSERMRFDLGKMARAAVGIISDEARLELEIVDPRTRRIVRAPIFTWNFNLGTRDFDRLFFMRKGRFADPAFLKLHCRDLLSQTGTR